MPAEIPQEIWNAVRSKLDSMDDDFLAKAIASDQFTEIYAKAFDEANQAFEEQQRSLAQLPHDELVERAFKLIQENGVAFPIDRGHYHAVYLHTRNGQEDNLF